MVELGALQSVETVIPTHTRGWTQNQGEKDILAENPIDFWF